MCVYKSFDLSLMKKLCYLFLLLLGVCAFKTDNLFAQNRTQGSQYWSVGAGIGMGHYFGDLAPTSGYGSTNLTYTRPSFSIFAAKRLNEYWGVEAELSYIRLKASDFENADPRNVRHRYRYLRNQNFRNDVIELALKGTFDLVPSRGDYYRRPTYRPYLHFGVAVFYHNPKGMTPDGDWVALQPLRTEGQGLVSSDPDIAYASRPYSLIQMAIPLGFGLKYKINDRMDLGFEFSYRYLFTDYIDDVSGNYADRGDLLNQVGELSAIMANRTVEGRDPISGATRDFQPVADGVAGVVTVTDLSGNSFNTVNGFGRIGDQRGDGSEVDIYITTSVKLHILLNTGLKCPKFRR
jgi:hypothetical protein